MALVYTSLDLNGTIWFDSTVKMDFYGSSLNRVEPFAHQFFFAMSDFNIYYRSVYESLYRVEPCLVLKYIADSDIKTWINPELHEGSTENMASCLLYIVMSMGVCP